MKSLVFPILLVICLLPLSLLSQDCQSSRYQERVFSNILKTSDLVYQSAEGVNDFEPRDYALDFYEPHPDEEYLAKRPFVLVLFGGAYLGGDKTDIDESTWCDSLAYLGYSCAVINYRIDNPINLVASTGNVERANYRTVQDSRAAIRFIIEDPNNQGFNIDPSHVFIVGESAGGITALNVGYADDSERPSSTFGNIFQADLGCLDCTGNPYQHDYTIKGIINLWGAILTLDFIDVDENIPVVSFHGEDDDIVPIGFGRPYQEPLFGFPLIPSMPEVYGSEPLSADLTAKGIYNEFYSFPGEGHTVYGNSDNFPNQYWEPIWADGKAFLWTIQQYDSPVPAGNLNPTLGTAEFYTVPDTSDSDYCWSVQNGQVFFENGSQIGILWDQMGQGTITVTEQNCIDIIGGSTSITVDIAPLPCPLELSVPTISQLYYQASMEINSTATVFGNSTILFRAGNNIILNNGFSTESNANFSAEIDPCQ